MLQVAQGRAAEAEARCQQLEQRILATSHERGSSDGLALENQIRDLSELVGRYEASRQQDARVVRDLRHELGRTRTEEQRLRADLDHALSKISDLSELLNAAHAPASTAHATHASLPELSEEEPTSQQHRGGSEFQTRQDDVPPAAALVQPSGAESVPCPNCLSLTQRLLHQEHVREADQKEAEGAMRRLREHTIAVLEDKVGVPSRCCLRQCRMRS